SRAPSRTARSRARRGGRSRPPQRPGRCDRASSARKLMTAGLYGSPQRDSLRAMDDDAVPAAPEHPAHLSDEQLVQRLNDHRRGSGEWAAVLGELQRRADRQQMDARFRAALESATDDLDPPDPA